MAKTADPLAVTWTERYSKTIDRIWSKIPNVIGSFIATVAVFLLGATIHGDWLLILVHFMKYTKHESESTSAENSSDSAVPADYSFSLKEYHLEGLPYFLIGGTTVSYIMFLGVGGFLHWYYYVRQRDRPEEWKCQPNKWMSPELERHEILFGAASLLLGSILSGVLSCYVANDGWTRIYYGVSEYGWVWYFLQWPVTFIWQDYLTYWHHRMYHTPFLYKNFHKMHHKYKQPTAFSVTAIHPVEFVHMQAVLMSPIFLWPIHWVTIIVLMMYIYYHGIIDHSGVNFKAYWWQPWQPPCIFHDNHHQYFHVNFGFNIEYWDHLHGTYRKKDRIYNENLFYGQGKSLTEASEAEIAVEVAERESENPLAFNSNEHEFSLKTEHLKEKKKTK